MTRSGDNSLLQGRLLALYKQYHNQEYCDITAMVGTEKFHVHACILAAACPKLHNLIQNEADGISSDVVTPAKELQLQMFTPSSFQHLLPYFYMGDMEYSDLSDSDLQEILEAAAWCSFDEVGFKPRAGKQIRQHEIFFHCYYRLFHIVDNYLSYERTHSQ